MIIWISVPSWISIWILASSVSILTGRNVIVRFPYRVPSFRVNLLAVDTYSGRNYYIINSYILFCVFPLFWRQVYLSYTVSFCTVVHGVIVNSSYVFYGHAVLQQEEDFNWDCRLLRSINLLLHGSTAPLKKYNWYFIVTPYFIDDTVDLFNLIEIFIKGCWEQNRRHNSW